MFSRLTRNVALSVLLLAVLYLLALCSEARAWGDDDRPKELPVVILHDDFGRSELLFYCVGDYAFVVTHDSRGGVIQPHAFNGKPMSCEQLWEIRRQRDKERN